MSDFRTMSNLVADAEDLLSRLEASTSPEVRALKEKVESSVCEMKSAFRERVKRPRETIDDSSVAAGTAIIVAVSAAAIATLICFAAFKRREA
jgi:hypothetical protein